MPVFDVNTDQTIKLTAKLERLHRSAFPVAVRSTLNDAAFHTKKVLPEKASGAFSKSNRPRLKSFIRSFSLVNKAQGFSLNKMTATVGISTAKSKKIAEGLEKQEKGGSIQSRKLLPHDMSRISSSYKKRLRQKYRLNQAPFVSGSASTKRSTKSNVVARAYVAHRTGKYLFQKKNKKGNRGTVFEIRRLSFKGKGSNRKVEFKVRPLYVYRRQSVSRVAATPFMKPAAISAAKQLPEFYKKNAEKQFNRLLK